MNAIKFKLIVGFLPSIILLLAVACSKTNTDPTPAASETTQTSSPAISNDFLKAMQERYKSEYAKLSDYDKALVACGGLTWIAGEHFGRGSPLSGQNTLPEECPDPSEFE